MRGGCRWLIRSLRPQSLRMIALWARAKPLKPFCGEPANDARDPRNRPPGLPDGLRHAFRAGSGQRNRREGYPGRDTVRRDTLEIEQPSNLPVVFQPGPKQEEKKRTETNFPQPVGKPNETKRS